MERKEQNNVKKAVFTLYKECKHSVRYNFSSGDRFIDSVYIIKDGMNGKIPKEITLTLQVKK